MIRDCAGLEAGELAAEDGSEAGIDRAGDSGGATSVGAITVPRDETRLREDALRCKAAFARRGEALPPCWARTALVGVTVALRKMLGLSPVASDGVADGGRDNNPSFLSSGEFLRIDSEDGARGMPPPDAAPGRGSPPGSGPGTGDAALDPRRGTTRRMSLTREVYCRLRYLTCWARKSVVTWNRAALDIFFVRLPWPLAPIYSSRTICHRCLQIIPCTGRLATGRKD